ncbi:MAG: hypothetical protein GY842_04315, partial [bacterium]|nr:hypothetical protein [bacterium]
MNRRLAHEGDASATPPRLGTAAIERELSLLEGLRAVPPRVARRHGVIPLRYEGDRLIAGSRDPRCLQARDALHRLGHTEVAMEPISEKRYQEVMAKWYGPTGDVAEYVAHLPR